MAIIEKIKQLASSPEGASVFLTKQEIEILLLMIKDATFRGEDVESIYNIVYKLQQNYVNQK
jgi:hypothetical protein